MRAFDVQRFLDERGATWRALAEALADVDQRGLAARGIDGAREFGRLYRAVSSDLLIARGEQVDASVVDHLNDLVARAYAHVHAGRTARARRVSSFLLQAFPRLFRSEWCVIALAALLFFGGAAVGAVAVGLDPRAAAVLIPEDHQRRTPAERVAEDEQGEAASGDEGAAFSSFLFTHNIQVTFLVFALGLTFGVGSVSLLFYNGVPIGALAMQYHQFGKGLFFWAWILPHGIPEITQILVAGAAGLLLARALWLPGRRSRRDALADEARRAMQLVVGGMPILVLAGLIEGTISQIHAPILPYALKLAFAAVVGVAVWSYLLFAGRSVSPDGTTALGEELEALAEAPLARDARAPSARRSSTPRARRAPGAASD
jgi:uncharacterized membrane protein SpoIIM required for sporulation